MNAHRPVPGSLTKYELASATMGTSPSRTSPADRVARERELLLLARSGELSHTDVGREIAATLGDDGLT